MGITRRGDVAAFEGNGDACVRRSSLVCALPIAGTAQGSHPKSQLGAAKGDGRRRLVFIRTFGAVIGNRRARVRRQGGPAPALPASLPPVECATWTSCLKARAQHAPRVPLQPRRSAGPDPAGLVPEQIADVAVYKNAAYLNSWASRAASAAASSPSTSPTRRNPRQLAFVPALPGPYHGEGAHVITLNTRRFQGDVLAVNNEACAGGQEPGGFDLYDVTNPANPKILVQGAGDRSADHAAGKPFGAGDADASRT